MMHSTRIPSARDAARRYVFTNGLFAPYFVFTRDAPPDGPVTVVIASSSTEAVREVTRPDDVLCSAGLLFGAPAQDDDGRVHTLDPWRVVSLRDGRALLVGRGGWLSAECVTHAALWSFMEADVRKAVEAQWSTFERDEVPLDADLCGGARAEHP